MRIAQMLDTLAWGGAQKMTLFLVQSLRPLGMDVTVISLNYAPESPLPAELQAAGARLVTFPFPQLFSPLSFLKLIGFLRRERFDLIQGYLTYTNILGSLAGRLSGTPFFGSFRNAGYDPARISARRAKLESFCLRHFADGIIANGYVVADFGHKQVGEDVSIDVLPNAVDVDIIPQLSREEKQTLRRELVGDADRPLILSVGRLTPQKGFDHLLQAFARVHEKHPNATLVIAGAGRLLELLATQIRALGLDGSAFLLGQRDDVPRLLAAADIYVNSSLLEGTPVSVLEAMAAGLPIVATSVGDTPHLLDSDSGILVPPAQPEALTDALTSLLDNPKQRVALGLAARARAKKEYSPQAWTRNLLKLYSKLAPSADGYLKKLDEVEHA
jgi:glycosyltransferase involved in cell wall biosynthesis